MTRRRVVAAFVTWHLFAIALGSIPPPALYSNFPKRDPALRQSQPVIVRVGTAAFDGLAAGIAPVVSGAWRLAQPVRPAVTWYLQLTGLGQSWVMFSNPGNLAEYARVRYYIQPAAGGVWTATELVLPAHREDTLRLVQSYRDSYRDKAIAIALDEFYRHRSRAQITPGARPEQLPKDLAPISRYFARAFDERYLKGTGQRIVRTDVWIGRAAIPGPGDPVDPGAHASRLAALHSYYQGPIERRLGVARYPPYHGLEQEADISWILEYYEEP